MPYIFSYLFVFVRFPISFRASCLSQVSVPLFESSDSFSFFIQASMRYLIAMGFRQEQR